MIRVINVVIVIAVVMMSVISQLNGHSDHRQRYALMYRYEFL
ncbi:hypothetical protein SAMN04487834_102016 [Sharpea azabuensis]|uniref:Uncharacterized protein n=1 Tax=Sharpea azabuensis TaxID=322505 RepID=A0A1H6TCW6_9FIRM|nr:hypothetical protein SAMN04487834_102016 [Sharpea azabuensis]